MKFILFLKNDTYTLKIEITVLHYLIYWAEFPYSAFLKNIFIVLIAFLFATILRTYIFQIYYIYQYKAILHTVSYLQHAFDEIYNAELGSHDDHCLIVSRLAAYLTDETVGPDQSPVGLPTAAQTPWKRLVICSVMIA